MLTNILSRLFIIFSLMAVGFLLDRRRFVSRDALQALSRIVVDVMMPALIFSSIVTQFSRDSILAGYKLPLLGLLTFSVGAAVGLIAVKLLKEQDREKKNTIIYLLTINNYGYLTVPLAYMLFGEQGVALLFLHNLGCHIVFWTFGVWLLSGARLTTKSLKPIINAPFIALLVSLAIPLIGAEKYVPALLIEVASTLGKGAIPLIMLVIGSTLAEIEFKDGFMDKTIVWIAAARLLIIPVIAILILKMLPLPELYRNIAIIVAVMPAASSTPLFTKQFGGDTPISAKAVFATTLLSAITIPLLLSIFLK